jgi:hypothetical protein
VVRGACRRALPALFVPASAQSAMDVAAPQRRASLRRASLPPFSIPWPLPIWLWLDYPNGRLPAFVELHLEAIERHAPSSHFRIMKLNRSNLGAYVPDLPPEVVRLPHQTAYSDLARIALLAHHGGLYADVDFVVSKSLVPFADHLTNVSLVGFKGTHRKDLLKSPKCDTQQSSFSPTFFAARPGTTVMRQAWISLKKALGSRCKNAKVVDDPTARLRSNTCCYSHTNGSAIKCQTPWALSDVMVRPSLRQRESEAIYCYGGRESFIPGLPTTHPTARHRLDYMLVYSTGLGKDNCSFADIDHSNVWARRRVNATTTVCCFRDSDDLECSFLWRANAQPKHVLETDKNVTLREPRFFDRVAYHTFSSLNAELLMQGRKELLDSNTIYGELLRQALGVRRKGARFGDGSAT